MPSISTNGSPSISIRSANVPESPSSALQTMNLRSPFASAAVFHLMPVGNPAPPRPRRPDCVTISIVAAGPISLRAREALQPAMRAIVIQRQRIDDAAAREGQPRLASRGTAVPPAAPGAACARRPPACRHRAVRKCPRPSPDHRRCGPRRWPPPPSAPARTGRASRCAPPRRRPPGAAARRPHRHPAPARRHRAGRRHACVIVRAPARRRSARCPAGRAARRPASPTDRSRTGRGRTPATA